MLVMMTTLFSLSAHAGDFTVGKGTFLLNGEPFIVKAAEVHYPRIPRPYWEHRIRSCKALGMNTICIYVFWNIHEQREGQFDFTGNSDVAEFCRLAQKNGMYVIVRPGPYVCAEWEMGGLPWWLLKKKDIRLREQDPYFMERVKIFEHKVGEQLAPLTIQNGGPIIMVQVENEYGSYGEDKAYISEIRDCLRGIYGNKMALFQCDWSSNFEKNGLDDLVWTMNFGTGANIDQQFARLKELRPDAPMMCSEFWSGWFDKWGARHETRPADDMVNGIDEMLSKGISFSLYMTHGGTSFGHWAGANSPGFAPDVTSYDYDAPINEYGWRNIAFDVFRRPIRSDILSSLIGTGFLESIGGILLHACIHLHGLICNFDSRFLLILQDFRDFYEDIWTCMKQGRIIRYLVSCIYILSPAARCRMLTNIKTLSGAASCIQVKSPAERHLL